MYQKGCKPRVSPRTVLATYGSAVELLDACVELVRTVRWPLVWLFVALGSRRTVWPRNTRVICHYGLYRSEDMRAGASPRLTTRHVFRHSWWFRLSVTRLRFLILEEYLDSFCILLVIPYDATEKTKYFCTPTLYRACGILNAESDQDRFDHYLCTSINILCINQLYG